MQSREQPGEMVGPPMQNPANSMWWGRERFLSVDVPDGKCPEVIDVTGRARILSYGPYAPLDAGTWRALASLDLSPDAARCRLTLQFGTAMSYATVDIPRGASGPRKVEVDFVCETQGLVEVRLVLMRAAFHGEIHFHGVEVRAIASSTTTIAAG